MQDGRSSVLGLDLIDSSLKKVTKLPCNNVVASFIGSKNLI